MLNYVGQFIEIRVVSTRFISEAKTVTPIFFAFLAQVTHYLTAVKISKKSMEWKIFARTSLKPNIINKSHAHQLCVLLP